MKLKKLLKLYDRDSYIVVRDTLTSVSSRPMTASDFIKVHGKDVLKREIRCIDVSLRNPYTIIIDI